MLKNKTLSIGVTIYDGNYKESFTIIDQIYKHIKLESYEIIIADNRVETKALPLPDGNARVIDMEGNQYTVEARRAITNNAYGEYIWLIDADDQIVADVTDSIWIEQDVDAYVLPVEVNTNKLIVSEYINSVVTFNIVGMYSEDFGNFIWDKFFNTKKLKDVYGFLPTGHIVYGEDDLVNYMLFRLSVDNNANFYYVDAPIIYVHNRNSSSITLSEDITEAKTKLASIGASTTLYFLYSVDPKYWAYMVLRTVNFSFGFTALVNHIGFIRSHLDELYEFAKQHGSLDKFKLLL